MNTEIKNFNDLDAWQNAHEIVLEIYKITRDLPKDELFGLVSQLRRATSSITANIAEGFERYHFKDKTRFYYQARGSVAEIQNFIILDKDLDYISSIACKDLDEKANKVRQLINGLIRSISNQQ